MIRFCAIPFLLLLILFSMVSYAATEEGRGACAEAAYSKSASMPRGNGISAIESEFPSPDGRKTIVVKEKPKSQPEIFVRIDRNEYAVEFPPWPCPEFQWAPDSKAFFVTYSDGGTVGNHEVLIFYPSSKGLRAVKPTSIVQKDFLSHYPKCFDPETPNLAGIGWLGNSRRLLVAAEVLPHSNCDMMGTFSLYEIKVPSGTVVKKYSQPKAKKLFGQLLGVELRNADDECFTKPGSCKIPQLHGEQKP